MNKAKLIVGLGLLTAAGLTWAASRRASSAAMAAIPDQDAPWSQEQPLPQEWATEEQTWYQSAQVAWAENVSPIFDWSEPVSNQNNVSAFLEAIAWAEGTGQRANPYAVCFAYKFTITNFADHPTVLGSWKGEPLSPSVCAAAGLGAGCVSTAAGKYQIIRPTWVGLKQRLRLPDFGPESQDAAAIQLLKDCGAYRAIELGQFSEAVRLARKTWASLPGAGYGQPERRSTDLQARYTAAGGVVVA